MFNKGLTALPTANDVKISQYKRITDKKGITSTTLGGFINDIKGDKYKEKAKEIRDTKDKKTRSKLKESLPNVTVSGIFSYLDRDGLIQLSGLIAMDFDNLGNGLSDAKAKLAKDPYTYALFTSISGNGLCAIVKTTKVKENHIKHFHFLEKHYKSEYNLEIDKACKDITRPRYLSYDPDAKVFEGSSVAGLLENVPSQNKANTAPKKDATFDLNEFERVVNRIENDGIAIVPDYDSYIKLAMAFSTQFGEDGRDYFHRVCSQSPKYNFNDANAKYDNAIATGRGAVGIKSFFYLCKKAGIKTYSIQRYVMPPGTLGTARFFTATDLLKKLKWQIKDFDLSNRRLNQLLKNLGYIEGRDKLRRRGYWLVTRGIGTSGLETKTITKTKTIMKTKMWVSKSKEDLKREIEVLKQENEALKQEANAPRNFRKEFEALKTRIEALERKFAKPQMKIIRKNENGNI